MINILDEAGIAKAADDLAGVIHHTPVVHSQTLSQMAGVSCYLKLENWQKTGSFKLRGAYHKLSMLSLEEKACGVVSASSGNHGQAVAWAATRLGISSMIIMPEDAALAKLEAARAYGAMVSLCGTSSDDRKARAEQIAAESGRVLISPFDDPHVICGQGTVAREILADLPQATTIVAPIGGGGLIAGIALATKLMRPDVRVIGVEPIGGNCMGRSLAAGSVQALEVADTVADGLRVTSPGKLNFAICRRYLDDVITVCDEQIVEAMRLLISRVKVVAEPSGAVSVAGVLSGAVANKGTVVAIISGGNVDLDRLSRLTAPLIS